MRAVGGNPKLASVNNKQKKQLNSIESSIEAKNVITKEFRNADAIDITDKEQEIVSINYAATEDAKPVLILTVRLEMSMDGVVDLQFYTDAVLDAGRHFREYLTRGEHIITLADVYPSKDSERHTISITAKTEYFESDTRKQEADIKTHKNFLQALADTGATVETDEETQTNIVVFPAYETATIDTTIPKATVKKNECLAIFYGQGIDGEGKWDGTLNFTDEIGLITFTSGFGLANITESVLSEFKTPTASVLAEQVNMAFSSNFTFASVVDIVGERVVIKDYTFSTMYKDNYTYDKYITANNDMFALKTIYNYESVEESIDSGKMCVVAIDYSGITVESVVVE